MALALQPRARLGGTESAAGRQWTECERPIYKPMVLGSYILNNYISILQTKSSDREGHEARRGGLEALPLDQHIEGRHGERQACLKIRPAPMHHLLQMTNEREHRQ